MNAPLKCPSCGNPLVKKNQCYVCCQGHSFDVAKSGYVNLFLCGNKASAVHGDNKEMISARRKVMQAGYCKPLFEAVSDEIDKLGFDISVMADIGCGEGFFARSFTARYGCCCVGIDISKSAADASAKLGGTYAVGSGKDLPLLSGSLDFAMCAFAPLFETEISRVLKDGGGFLHIMPAKDHLMQLKRLLYDDVVENDEPSPLSSFTLKKEIRCDYDFTVGGDDAAALITMTPYYYRTAPSRIQRALEQPTLTVDLHFIARIYQK